MAPTPSVTNLTPPSREVTVLQRRRDSIGHAELRRVRHSRALPEHPLERLLHPVHAGHEARQVGEEEEAMVWLDADHLDAGTGDEAPIEREEVGVPHLGLVQERKREADVHFEPALHQVAEQLGGRPVTPTRDLAEVALVQRLVEQGLLDLLGTGPHRDGPRGELEAPRLVHDEIHDDITGHVGRHPSCHQITLENRPQHGSVTPIQRRAISHPTATATTTMATTITH